MTSPHTAREIYEQHIKSLPAAERLQLLAVMAHDLASANIALESSEQNNHSIMGLHGLGAHIWVDVDPQDYVNKLRQEWDRRTPPDEA